MRRTSIESQPAEELAREREKENRPRDEDETERPLELKQANDISDKETEIELLKRQLEA